MSFKILIFGSGFIGTNLISQLLQYGHRVTVIDRGSKPLDLPEQVIWYSKDFFSIINFSDYLSDVDIVYHLFSSSIPADSIVHHSQESNRDIQLTLKILDSCVANNVSRFVFASSSSVYGIQDSCPISEVAGTWPISPHGIQKLTIERYLWLYKHLHCIDIRIARISHPYGPGQSIEGRQGIVAILIGSLLNKKPFRLSCSLDVIRDFIYIDDLSRGLSLYGLFDSAPSVLNLGSGIGRSIGDVIVSLETLSKSSIVVEHLDARASDIPVSILDISLAQRSIGFKPYYSFMQGLSATYTFALNLHTNF